MFYYFYYLPPDKKLRILIKIKIVYWVFFYFIEFLRVEKLIFVIYSTYSANHFCALLTLPLEVGYSNTCPRHHHPTSMTLLITLIYKYRSLCRSCPGAQGHLKLLKTHPGLLLLGHVLETQVLEAGDCACRPAELCTGATVNSMYLHHCIPQGRTVRLCREIKLRLRIYVGRPSCTVS